MFESNLVGPIRLLSLTFLKFNEMDYSEKKYSHFNIVTVFFVSFFILHFSLSFSTFHTFSDYGEQRAYGHFFGTTDSTLSGAQNQTAGNYVVELLLNPSKPMIGRDTSFLMQVKSTAGDVLIELPVAFYILKDGKPVYSHANNYTIVSQGHYDFNYTFHEPGKYILFVDVKDIFYTLDTLSVNFEIDVQAPILDRLSGLIVTFVANYYYVYIPVLALITLSYAIRLKRHRGVKK